MKKRDLALLWHTELKVIWYANFIEKLLILNERSRRMSPFIYQV
ncbi:hypothetical protein [Lederbergia galactosidilytica]|nr:hypothetical protein [Lederbergia galactosidilytica]MBP1915682.1 hypothetical protein [Lederbergia galactosidilytica]